VFLYLSCFFLFLSHSPHPFHNPSIHLYPPNNIGWHFLCDRIEVLRLQATSLMDFLNTLECVVFQCYSTFSIIQHIYIQCSCGKNLRLTGLPQSVYLASLDIIWYTMWTTENSWKPSSCIGQINFFYIIALVHKILYYLLQINWNWLPQF
jgi:hypothetical protein